MSMQQNQLEEELESAIALSLQMQNKEEKEEIKKILQDSVEEYRLRQTEDEQLKAVILASSFDFIDSKANVLPIVPSLTPQYKDQQNTESTSLKPTLTVDALVVKFLTQLQSEEVGYKLKDDGSFAKTKLKQAILAIKQKKNNVELSDINAVSLLEAVNSLSVLKEFKKNFDLLKAAIIKLSEVDAEKSKEKVKISLV